MLENERLQQQLGVGDGIVVKDIMPSALHERIKKLMLKNERLQQHLDDGIVVVKDIP